MHAGHGHYGHCLRVPPLPLLREHTENIIPVARSLCVALYMGDGHGGQLQWSEPLQGSKVTAFLTLKVQGCTLLFAAAAVNMAIVRSGWLLLVCSIGYYLGSKVCLKCM